MATWSGPISLKGAKGDSTPQTLPNDLTGNSLSLAPVAGDSAPSQLALTSSTGSSLFKADGQGNVSAAGTLAAGAATLGATTVNSLTDKGDASVAGALAVTGASTLGSLTASSASVAGPLSVTGATTLAGTTTAALTASSASVANNASVGGNLNVTGTLTAGAITGSSTNIAGSQQVQGNDTITGNLSVGGTSSLQGAVTCGSDLTATSGSTKLGPVQCTTISASGAATFATTVAVTGTITPGAVNCQNNTNVGKNLVVSGTTQTVGLLTATGNISTPQMNVQSGGSSVLGTASADALTTSGNINIGGTATLQAVNAANLTTSGNFRSNGNLSCTSGTTTLGGPVNISGATTMAALTASSASTSGNVSVGGTLGVTGASTLAGLTASTASVTNALTASSASVSANATVGGTLGVTGATTLAALTASSSSIAGSETVGATLTAKNLTLTSGGGGVLTFADGTTLATAPTSTGSSSSSGGGGGGGVVLDTFFMGTFVNAGNNFPTSYTSADAYFVNAQYSAQGAASRSGCAYTATYAANVYSIQGYVVGNVGSATVSIGLYKNGSLTALEATYTGGGGGFKAIAPTGSPISVAVGDVLQFFVKSTSSTTNTPIVGWMSLQQPGGGGGASIARTAIEMGVYQYGTNSAGGYSATKKAAVTAGSNTNGSNVDYTWIAPWPGSIVGYSMQQNSSGAATNSVIYRKNGTNNTSFNVGSGAGNFQGTHAVGTYTFAAGDKIQFLTGISNGGNTDINAMMYVQWSA